ncbi:MULTISPECIES: class I SAM-dependent methyltransferase [Rhodococcus]|uniref:methyltransferase domain-containing protein n=1 Tax=Rhodococcus TaxID=1827 RepID=UPI000586C441|nr:MULTISPECIES: class I SAM-dependent methyltransferase [Rhodococcus]
MRRADVSTDLLMRRASAGLPCWVRDVRGTRRPLPVGRWMGGDASSLSDRIADRVMLTGCHGATVDLGCGPGRLTAALVSAGVAALGVDSSFTAVQLTIRRGGLALHRDIFAPLPRSGHWDRVLLADGNIGIGGEPVRILRRARELLQPYGIVIAEVDPPTTTGVRHELLRWETEHLAGEWFAWASVSVAAMSGVARAAGLSVIDVLQHANRYFVRMEWA